MTTKLITAPAALALSLAEARLAARRQADDTSLDTELTILIKGLTRDIEQRTGRSIINRTYQQILDTFPDAIQLYFPPISSVSWVKYYDADGVLQTLDPQDYQTDLTREGYIVAAPDVEWPETEDGRINAVMVQYVAGYGADSTSTPDDFRLYMMAKITENYYPSKNSDWIERLIDGSGEKIWSLG